VLCESQGISRTHHMLVSVWGRLWRKVNLVMFTVYLDDSGTAPSQRVAIASAFIIPAKQIVRLEREWENLKEKENFSEFHTSEMIASNEKSDFATWDEEKKRRVFRRVREISKKYGIYPSASVCFAVNKIDYEDIVPEDLRSGLGKNHYAWAIRHVIQFLDNWRLRPTRNVGPLEYVFDWLDVGSPCRVEIETIMQQAEAKATYYGRVGEYTNFSFRRRKDIPGLQCVGAIAWTCYTQALSFFCGTPAPTLSFEAWRHYGGHLEADGWLKAFTITRDQLQDWVDREAASGNMTMKRLIQWEESKTYLP